MKLAITGKGGVGKTTIGAGLALLFAREGRRVIAVDADSDSNLAATLGFPDPDGIHALVDDGRLIEERTGARPGAPGALFALNPRVDDLPESYCVHHQGIRLLTLGGRHRRGGSGCFCPESSLLRSLLSHLLLERDDVVILDMDAGIENLTRGTARGVDSLLVVVEPGGRSLETAHRIAGLAGDLKIDRIQAVANKVRSPADRLYVERSLNPLELIASIPYRDEVRASGMGERSLAEALEGPLGRALERIRLRLGAGAEEGEKDCNVPEPSVRDR